MGRAQPAVLVIGAGPAGLAVASCLRKLRVSYEWVDRHGSAGGSYLRMYSRMKLSSPPVYLGLPGAGPPQSKANLEAGEYASYLRLYAAANDTRVVCENVRSIERSSPGFTVGFDRLPACHYDAVVVCTGMFDNPYIPVVPGLNDSTYGPEGNIHFDHASRWNGLTSVEGSRPLIIGGGMTGIEIAEECVRAGIKPMMSFKPRQGRTFPAHLLGFDPRFLAYPILRTAPVSLFRRQCIDGWMHRGIDRGFRRYCAHQQIDIRPPVH